MSITGFCPRCQSLQNMVVTTLEREEFDSDGNVSKILTKRYDCENCGSTLWSEDVDLGN